MSRSGLPKFAFLALTVLMAVGSTRTARAGTEGNIVLDPTAMDTSVDPCQDFYQYSCGKWLERTELPSDQSSWARSFSTIYEGNLNTLHEVLENYAKGQYTPSTPYASKLGAYYASCMDEAAVEKGTDAAIKSRLGIVEELRTKRDLPLLLAKLHLQGIGALFQFGPSPDLKVPTLMIGEIDQGGMGLPDSSYYTKTDEASETIRKAYRAHIARMLVLTGVAEKDAAAQAETIFALESRLAAAALPPEKMQDPTELYHPMDLAGLVKESPDFNWSSYFLGLGIAVPGSINVSEPKFTEAVNEVIKTTDVASLKTYLRFQILESIAPALGSKIYNEYFDFNGRTLGGQKNPSARWKRCVQAASSSMGEAVGQAFVKKSFSPRAKQRVLELIDKLRDAFETDFQTLEWLDQPTRQQALEKLALLTRKIGYPDQWRKYDALEVGRKPFWMNRLLATVFNTRFNLAKIGGKTDPNEWHMTPQTVNAYYDPSVNQINFPAGILQPPFFSETANDAQNFGAIGMVIGHEMTHGFDTSGSQFDGHGAQRDWWTAPVKTLFRNKAQCLMDQYDQYEVLPGVKVNGKLTITENIADQGGLKLAYNAFKLASKNKPTEPVAGLDGDQQFYVSMAQLWCSKDSDAYLRQQVSGDPHSPARFRVIGTVVDSPSFAAAFRCATGTPMAPATRCPIW